jgi:hypothetical protein
MAKPECPRDAALSRISQQEVRVAKQKVLIANLKAKGTPTVGAEQSLATMEDVLSALRNSLHRYPF